MYENSKGNLTGYLILTPKEPVVAWRRTDYGGSIKPAAAVQRRGKEKHPFRSKFSISI